LSTEPADKDDSEGVVLFGVVVVVDTGRGGGEYVPELLLSAVPIQTTRH
jgi:hypothetical protein